jgi:DNA-directed RNA polymerase specialized sigma24 family protein
MSDLHHLLERTLTGDPEAWRSLQAQIEPTIVAIARRHSSMRSRGLNVAPDDIREVAVATLERLARDDFRNLRRFLESAAAAGPNAAPNFDSWLYGAVDFVIREHLRSRYGRAPKPAADGEAPAVRPSKRDAHSLAGRIDDTDNPRMLLQTVSMTTRLTAAEVFGHIDEHFASDEARALRLYYLEDQSFSEIARALGLADDKSADKLIRRLNARLRYHFGIAGDGA